MSVELKCDMAEDCNSTITYVDDKGFIYCTAHGQLRQSWRRCRKLRPHELARLRAGKQLIEY
jgi:hypothetical protein